MAPTTSKNLLLAAVVALSVYVPFETVAKVSLIAAAFLFVVDPIPPYSRLIAIVSCLIVLKLNKFHRDSIINQQREEDLSSVEIIAVGDDESVKEEKNKEASDSKKDK
eukprot:CAMPEP_0116122296 /NCGR_PEP_ID=MMETSP0329-20121206/4140_1 /TAXON_ID=697910 /ORGANISM="Pseudo-nitzschia arenysensis, Strain B593" /LENGTH=107 /DNA_ID=CAMNT_0003616137 /DNA_START=97 /DNA_END=420 /DNA_ORIENTATION=-